MEEPENKRNLVAAMHRLVDFAGERQIHGINELNIMRAFVEGADFITKDKYESHLVVAALEKVAKIEAEFNKTASQIQEAMNQEPTNSWLN